MAIYHIFTRTSERRYDSVRAVHFAKDSDAVAFAEKLLAVHPIVEVWNDETLVTEWRRKARTS